MTTTLNAATAGAGGLISTADASGVLQLQTAGTAALTIDGSQNVTLAGNITLNNGAADGAQVTLSSSGYSDWNIDNYSGSFRLYNGVTERLRLDTSGNLGLGVTPSAWASNFVVSQIGRSSYLAGRTDAEALYLGVNNYWNGTNDKYIQTGYASYYSQGSGAHNWYRAASGTAGTNITFTNSMSLDASGNLGIGTTSPSSAVGFTPRVQIAGSYPAYILQGTEASAKKWTIGETTGALAFYNDTDSAERMRIDSSGNLLVGTTTAAGSSSIDLTRPANTATYIHVLKNTQAEATWGFKSSTDTNMYIGSGSPNVGTFGVYLTNTGSSWNAVSDERMKTIVEPINNAAKKVASLRTVIGYYNNDEKQIRRPFLIAQDVQAVLPEAVNIQNQETGTLGMSYTDTIPLLVAAIKEQQALITQLTERITALENK